ncbi:MAG TPA: alpha-L-rhamnosidase [Verrucomicrobiae bacterium]|nr:alpha-L-rhamnosidase [Verrucomicrobiae bacterium]
MKPTRREFLTACAKGVAGATLAPCLARLGYSAQIESGAEALAPRRGAGFEVRKAFLPQRLHLGNTGIYRVQPIDDAAWLWYPEAPGSPAPAHKEFFYGGWSQPVLLRFRKEFEAPASPVRIHVSADERFELFLDGIRIARGPDRCDVERWSYATYDMVLAAGSHRVEALVWSIGPRQPVAQLSWRGGFVLKAEGPSDEQLTTGKAAWEVARLEGYEFAPGVFFVGAELIAHDCGPQWKEGEYVKPQTVRSPVRSNSYGETAAGWKLFPTRLPDQIDHELAPGRVVAMGKGLLGSGVPVRAEQTKDPDLPKWDALLQSRQPIVIPSHSERFVLWDLENYYCAYPLCEVSGGAGASIAWSWAESLYLPGSEAKGNRGEFIGKTFRGMTDTFLPGGGANRKFSTLWWRAGRWCLVSIKTAAAPLTLHGLALNESRYPCENEGAFDAGDPQLPGVIGLAVRGIQMCSHETFMDCPFYEQLMYVGDTRLEVLTTGVMTRDDRLIKRALELFDFSRRNWGFVNERYPAFIPQLSPTFSMIWALMLNDFTFWHNDADFLKARVIGLRSMLEEFDPYVNSDGLLSGLPGWSFMDWVPQWQEGYAPDGEHGLSALNNLLYLYALQKSAEVEDFLQEPLLAQRLRSKARSLAAALQAKFWNQSRGLIADNLAQTEFSEHAQCLALLTDTVAGAQASRCFEQLLTAPDLKRATIYFSFYLLETWQKFGRGDLIVQRMKFWKDLVKQGLKTPVEMPGNTRSDCHGWGSHPLFHLHASLAGVRPASPGFRTARIAPLPGSLPRISSRTPHPEGFIGLDLAFERGHCRGAIELPGAVSGVFSWQGDQQALSPGKNPVDH